MPRVSVVTICKNEVETIEKTLLSVLEQRFSDMEYVVIDGASSDGTANVLNRYRDRIDILISEKDDGIYQAMNKGLSISSGDYIYILNGGDRLYDVDVLNDIFRYENQEEIIYGDMIFDFGKGKLERRKQPYRIKYSRFIGTSIWQPASIVHRDVFRGVGCFNEKYKICADYEFFLKAVFKFGASLRYIPIVFSVFDTTGISRSPAYKILHQKERAKIQKEFFPFHYYLIARMKPFLLAKKERVWARIALKLFRDLNNVFRLGK